jgi:hypothetical protein
MRSASRASCLAVSSAVNARLVGPRTRPSPGRARTSLRMLRAQHRSCHRQAAMPPHRPHGTRFGAPQRWRLARDREARRRSRWRRRRASVWLPRVMLEDATAGVHCVISPSVSSCVTGVTAPGLDGRLGPPTREPLFRRFDQRQQQLSDERGARIGNVISVRV